MIRRVAIVAPHFAEYSERLAAGLAAQVPTWLALNTRNRAAQVERPIPSEARLVVMPMDRRPHQALALLRCVAAAALFRADVVIVQEGVRAFLKPLVWLLRSFTRVALIVHDPAPHSGSDSALAAVHVPYRRWLRDHADALIVHGDTCRRELTTLGYDEVRIMTINHGVLMVPEHSEQVVPEARRILMFGRMEAYKGLDILLDAVALLNARGVAHHLIVAGAGPEQARLAERMAALGTVEAIPRYLSPDELEREIARASFVVAPYTDATQSGVLASTFANGRPAIASDVGGLGDVVKHDVNGLLVPPGNAVALADAMMALLEDPARTARLAEGAKRFAADELDWGTIAGRLLVSLRQMPHPRRALRTIGLATATLLAVLIVATGALLVRAAPAWARDPARYDAPDCSLAGSVDTMVAGKPGDPPVDDMYGTSEIVPAGLNNPDGQPMSFALHPRIALGNDPPAGWPSMVPWGQVFISVAGDRSTNTRVEVRDLRLFVRPKATGAWCLLQANPTPKGARYNANYVNDRNGRDEGEQRVEPDGGRSFKPRPGMAIHFYGLRHVAIPTGGLTGVYAEFEARLIRDDPHGPDDRRLASLVASAGTDYWATDQFPFPPLKVLAEDAGIGRFRRVTTKWQTYSMNTAAAGAIRRPM